MKDSKKLIVLLLAVIFVFGFAGCSKKLTKTNLISEFEAYGLKKSEKFDIVRSTLSGRGGDQLYYVAKDNDEAKKLSNIALNMFESMPEIKANDFVLAAITEKGSDDRYYESFVCYMTFENNEEAEKTYRDLIETYVDEDDVKTGKESDVTYCLDTYVSAAGYNKIGDGVYLQGNTVIYLRTKAAVNDKYVFADTICGKFGLPSPSTATTTTTTTESETSSETTTGETSGQEDNITSNRKLGSLFALASNIVGHSNLSAAEARIGDFFGVDLEGDGFAMNETRGEISTLWYSYSVILEKDGYRFNEMHIWTDTEDGHVRAIEFKLTNSPYVALDTSDTDEIRAEIRSLNKTVNDELSRTYGEPVNTDIWAYDEDSVYYDFEVNTPSIFCYIRAGIRDFTDMPDNNLLSEELGFSDCKEFLPH